MLKQEAGDTPQLFLPFLPSFLGRKDVTAGHGSDLIFSLNLYFKLTIFFFYLRRITIALLRHVLW